MDAAGGGAEEQSALHVMPPSPVKKTWSEKPPGIFRYLFKNEIKKQYTFKRVLGTGGFATVRLAVRNADGLEVAVKEIEKRKLGATKKEQDAELTQLKKEITVLENLRCSKVVQLFEVFETPKKLWLVMEYLKGGELLEVLNRKTFLMESEMVAVVKSLLQALSVMHNSDPKIVHRDLKPENMIFTDETLTSLKVTDFGLSSMIDSAASRSSSTNAAMMQTSCGTPTYIAPEILLGQGYGEKVDLWSVGVIMFLVLCGEPPFWDWDGSDDAVYAKILAADYSFSSPHWKPVSEEAKDMIRRLLVLDPAARLSADEALQHPFVLGTSLPEMLPEGGGEGACGVSPANVVVVDGVSSANVSEPPSSFKREAALLLPPGSLEEAAAEAASEVSSVESGPALSSTPSRERADSKLESLPLLGAAIKRSAAGKKFRSAGFAVMAAGRFGKRGAEAAAAAPLASLKEGGPASADLMGTTGKADAAIDDGFIE